MITTKILLSMSLNFQSLLFFIAISLSDSKGAKAAVSTPELRHWESTGIVNCTAEFVFTCRNDSTTSLPLHKRCDGNEDCEDKSDEQKCTECRTPFSVHDTDGFLECITSSEMRNHAENREELAMRKDLYQACEQPERDKMARSWEHGCSEDSHRCTHGPLCLPSSSVCDGIDDCRVPRMRYSFRDYYPSNTDTDERNCTTCNGGAKMCKPSGKCIPVNSLCNGQKDCSDGSDEKECTCATCSGAGRALCGSGECIHEKKVCDGVIDCEDASDEQDCPTSCGRKVTNSTIMPTIVTCDSWSDKPHFRYLKSEICAGRVSHVNRWCGWRTECTRAECDCRMAFFCDGMCIPKSRVCDGRDDCYGGEDERNCLKACDTFPYFTCINKQGKRTKCLTPEHRCDGVRDCVDGSDEKMCDKCPADAHRCDGGCVPATSLCDGVKDCKDGSDEKNCSCEACTSGRLDTYSCEASGVCLKKSDACGPHSLCPHPTARDELFCAGQTRRETEALKEYRRWN